MEKRLELKRNSGLVYYIIPSISSCNHLCMLPVLSRFAHYILTLELKMARIVVSCSDCSSRAIPSAFMQDSFYHVIQCKNLKIFSFKARY